MKRVLIDRMELDVFMSGGQYKKFIQYLRKKLKTRRAIWIIAESE